MSLVLAALLTLQNIDPAPQPRYADLVRLEVPVIAGDITDRPYRVLAEVKADVPKLTIFSKDPSEAKVYQALWKQARKHGAHAVLNARYSEAVPGGWTWGRRKAYGQAVQFLTDAEIAILRATGKLR